ncbi:hypothetical protein AOQ84DRAFT_277660, partial [Glonium stellatum]
GMSAMHHAACAKSDQGVVKLLKLNVFVDLEDSTGWTSLHWAAKFGNAEVAEKLLEVGAD